MVLRTRLPEIVLRQLSIADVPAISRFRKANLDFHGQFNIGDPPSSEVEVVAWLASSIQLEFGVWLGEQLVGICDLGFWDHSSVPVPPGTEGEILAGVGYVVDEAHVNRGYATAACIAMVDYAFTIDSVSHVRTRAMSANQASCRVLEKAGFPLINVDNEWCVYERQRPFVDLDPLPGDVERSLSAYYDQEADERAERSLDPKRVAARTEFISLLGGPGRGMIEVGIGPGKDAAAFVAGGVPTVGIDLSVEHARFARLTGADVLVASVRHLPFADGSFDSLWTMSTLMHVPNVAITGALAEVRRVLAPGALAAIGVWGGPDVEHYREGDRYQPPRFFSRRSDERWRSLLTILGSIEAYETWGDDGAFWYQWALVRTT